MDQPSGDHIHVYHLDAGACAAAYRHVLIVCYAEPPSADLLRHRIHWLHELDARYGKGMAMITVLRGRGTSLPDQQSRDETKRQMAEFGDKVPFIATAVEMPGVAGVSVRTLLRAIALAAHKKFPFQFFATANEAVVFAATELERSAPGIGEALEHRQQLRRLTDWLKAEQDRLGKAAGVNSAVAPQG